jgi:hypothetical protein
MEDWAQVLEGFLQWFSSQNIYIADETSLYYNLLPERTLAVRQYMQWWDKKKGLLTYSAMAFEYGWF